MSLRAYLLACDSQVVKELKIFETKKAVEDDGLQDPALFRTCLACQIRSASVKGLWSLTAGDFATGARACQQEFSGGLHEECEAPNTCGISLPFVRLSHASGQVTYALRTRLPLSPLRGIARLACLIHAASVHSEPGSNSPSNQVSAQARRPGPRTVDGRTIQVTPELIRGLAARL